MSDQGDGDASRRLPVALASNGVEIGFDGDRFAPMRESSEWLGSPEVVRRRFRDDGYLLLRGVLDRPRVLELRGDYFARFDPSMLAPGSSAADGVFSGSEPASLPSYGTAGHPAYELVRSQRFDDFTREPRLSQIAAMILDGPVELLPRRIVRHFHRASANASRAHVDFDYLDQGSDQLVTAWIPLGDCPIQTGGLIYLEGSHRVARDDLDALRPFTDRPDDHRPLSNDLDLTARTLGGRWLWTDYRAGDVVWHSPHIVHASLDNATDVMRLSADIRFRRRDAKPDERWNGDWSADDGF